ncbi:hypothetical protein ACIRU3_25545 [Streptomyces sp. NPDC101151]|uniref:hypothetical protein n=1 Tax=Streptomyces sp. NPDC101151 TaxID=3366115 RepID=UPI003823D76E
MPCAPDGNLYDWIPDAQSPNNARVIVVAHDHTGAAEYRDGATPGSDRIFGSNALNIWYATNYGEVNSDHQQHSP